MKYAIILTLLFIAIISCRAKDKSKVKRNELIEKFKPFLHGNWVVADYIDDVVKTRSPLKSSDKLRFISEFSIDSANFSKDSMDIGAGFGNHEGGNFILYFRQGQYPNSLVTNIKDFESDSDTYNLGYIVSDRDTELMLYHYKNEKLVDKVKYIRSPKPNIDANANALEYMINKKLISGTYKIIDSTGLETIAELTNDGKITGFPGFTTYYILADFVAESENVTDEMCFEIQTSKQKCFEFKINADTINLFEQPKDEQDSLLRSRPVIYRFIKQR